MGSNTTLHAFEEWIKLPYLEKADTLIENEDGNEVTVQVTGFPSGCRGFYSSNENHVAFLIDEAGLISKGKVADADVIILPSLDLADVIFDKLYDKPDFLLCRREKCAFCAEGRKKIEKERDHIQHQYMNIKEAGVYRGNKGLKD